MPTAELVGPPAAAPMEKPTGPVDTCVTAECHTREMAGRVLHGPMTQERCDACHVVTSLEKHTYQLIVPLPELCSYCHTQAERTFVHKPVADKECVKCHDPHGSDLPLQLLGEPSGTLCFPCHEPEVYAGRRHVEQDSLMVGACHVCHESHSSWMPKLLPKGSQELCLFCHMDVRIRLELLGRPHAPVLDGQCLDCHSAHATGRPGQLRLEEPQLCYSCHEHDSIKTLVESSPRVHGALEAEQSCDACHVGHGDVMPALLAGPEEDLCLSCHNEPLIANDGRMLADMASLLKENPRHHGPIQDGQCTPCHASHASTRYGLLTMDYPESFYVGFTTTGYALCFDCHIEELVTRENGIGVTEFRDQERNLHFLHVNKEVRGRSCRACHEVHASARPFHMRETVPFGPGDWVIEIDYTPLPNGGSCESACHDTKSYDRGEGEMAKAPRAGLKPEKL